MTLNPDRLSQTRQWAGTAAYGLVLSLPGVMLCAAHPSYFNWRFPLGFLLYFGVGAFAFSPPVIAAYQRSPMLTYTGVSLACAIALRLIAFALFSFLGNGTNTSNLGISLVVMLALHLVAFGIASFAAWLAIQVASRARS